MVFFWNFLVWVEYERNSEVKFFFSFSACLIPFWLKIMSEKGFLILSIYLLFFSEFSCPSRVWTEFGSKIFFLSFSAYLIPFWLKIMLQSGFKFFEFFYYFFRNFLGRVEYERHSGVKFFSLFLGLSHPVLAKNNIGKRFFNFFNFFALFLEFSCLSRVWTEFGSKIFFSLSRPISSRLG